MNTALEQSRRQALQFDGRTGWQRNRTGGSRPDAASIVQKEIIPAASAAAIAKYLIGGTSDGEDTCSSDQCQWKSERQAKISHL
jgi:hypothetical protein